MISYVTIIMLSLLLFFLYKGLHVPKARIDRNVVTLFFVSYLVLVCFRDISVGNDTSTYLYRFQIMSRYSWDSLFSYSGAGNEPGFLVLNKLISMVGGFRLLVIVVACISIIPIIYLYRNEAEGALFCLSFYLISLLFGLFFSGMRQGIAIGLAIPAYYLSKKRKLLYFICVVALAFSFHRTGALIGLIYPIYHAKITRKWLWVVIPGMIAIYYFRDRIFSLLFVFMGEDGYSVYNILTGTSNQGALMVLFILLAIYSYIILDEAQAGEEEIGLRNILMLATFIHLFTPLNPVFGRINFYFILFIPVAISRINNRCKEQYLQIRNIAVIVMPTFFILYFIFFKTDSLGIMNYKFFF